MSASNSDPGDQPGIGQSLRNSAPAKKIVVNVNERFMLMDEKFSKISSETNKKIDNLADLVRLVLLTQSTNEVGAANL
jgi:hypothetical protein